MYINPECSQFWPFPWRISLIISTVTKGLKMDELNAPMETNGKGWIETDKPLISRLVLDSRGWRRPIATRRRCTRHGETFISKCLAGRDGWYWNEASFLVAPRDEGPWLMASFYPSTYYTAAHLASRDASFAEITRVNGCLRTLGWSTRFKAGPRVCVPHDGTRDFVTACWSIAARRYSKELKSAARATSRKKFTTRYNYNRLQRVYFQQHFPVEYR